jgi:hypothetical protein
MRVAPGKPVEEHRFALQRTGQVLQELPLGEEAPIRRLGEIGPVLAVAFAPGGGPAFSSTADGKLRVHDRATFAVRASYALPAPAYELALAPEAGRLFAALPVQGRVSMNRMGYTDRPFANLGVFDVRGILRGETPPGPLRPAAVIQFKASIHSLAFSRDGKQLYCLSQADTNLVVTALAVDTGKEVGRFTFLNTYSVGPGAGLAVPPDGGFFYDPIYVLSGARVFTVNAGLTHEIDFPVPIRLSTSSVALEQGMLVLVQGSAGQADVSSATVLDMNEHQIANRWLVRIPGQPELAASADGRRLWLSTSAVLGGRVLALDHREPDKLPTAVGQATSTTRLRSRGRLFVSPDGAQAVLSNGMVFQASP